ncbi:tyrosine-type recombinase/integrase [Bifidobacterium longum]|uniref:tyrosine-type recombinase/integrase n=1 Tax=Bifidobacterium longum TaxID=216816 RepID=UPI0010399230|nr:tyrosine-type recombinase/integrase [Bifidobacterium longum]
MSKKINAPPVWREEITQYLDVLKAGGQSKGTLTTRRCQLSQMARDLQGVPADVSDDALVSWFARHEWKPETRKSYRNAVTGFFSWLHTTGRAAANPAEALPSVRRPHAHPRPCPDSVILAALGRANAAERTMIRLAAEAGLRRAEIAAVHSRDVMRDLVGRSLIVRGKGDKQRIVPLPDDLAGIIMDARGYLFPGRFGGHVEESYVGDHISHLLPRGYAAHTLRHRFATTAYAATHDLFVVAELLGHESVETTEHYVAMPDGRLREAAAAVRLI